MTRRVTVLCLLSLTLLLPAVLRAEFIPPGKESAILSLFAPYGIDSPADQLGNNALLAEVQIKDSTIVVVVTAGGKSGSLALTALEGKPEKATGELLARSRSFAIWSLDGKNQSPAVAAALKTVAGAVQKNDTTDFWSTNTVAAKLPEAPPVVSRSDRSEVPEPDRPFGAMTYILLGLAVLFLGANVPALRIAATGHGTKFWALLVITIAIGGAARFQTAKNVPARKADPTSVTCRDATNCDDGNHCTKDVCEVGECIYVADAALGEECCLVDRDCPTAEGHCEESYCNLELSRCNTRGTCFEDGVAPPAEVAAPVAEAPLPPSTLATWIFTAAGNDATRIGVLEARDMAVISSTVGLVFLALFLLVSGATTTTVLSAVFLAAVFPAALICAGAGGAAGLVWCLLALTLLAVALVARTRAEGGLPAWAALGLFVLATGLLGWQRPEFALVPVIYLVLVSLKRPQLRLLLLGAAAIGAAIAALQFWRLFAGSELYVNTLPLSERAGIALRALLVTGQAVPFLLILAAMLGIVTAPRGKRMLPLLGIVAFLAAYGHSALLAPDAVHAVRLAMPLAILLSIPAGIGIAWIAGRTSTYSMLCVVILVVYFALFPLVRRNALLALTVTSTVEQPDRIM